MDTTINAPIPLPKISIDANIAGCTKTPLDESTPSHQVTASGAHGRHQRAGNANSKHKFKTQTQKNLRVRGFRENPHVPQRAARVPCVSQLSRARTRPSARTPQPAVPRAVESMPRKPQGRFFGLSSAVRDGGDGTGGDGSRGTKQNASDSLPSRAPCAMEETGPERPWNQANRKRFFGLSSAVRDGGDGTGGDGTREAVGPSRPQALLWPLERRA